MSTPQKRRPIEPTSTTVPGTLEKVVPNGAQGDSLPVAVEQTPPIPPDAPEVVPMLEAAWAPSVLRHSSRTASQSKHVQVYVALNLRELLAIPPVQSVVTAGERHGLDKLVQAVLFVGLVISTVLMLTGMGLDMVGWHTIPIAVPNIDDGFDRLLDPFGFLTVGLLILIATPITSVVAAILVLLRERDWRYAGITTLVLVILIASLLLGSNEPGVGLAV